MRSKRSSYEQRSSWNAFLVMILLISFINNQNEQYAQGSQRWNTDVIQVQNSAQIVFWIKELDMEFDRDKNSDSPEFLRGICEGSNHSSLQTFTVVMKI